MPTAPQTILLAGATGMVGAQVVQMLADRQDIDLHLLARRAIAGGAAGEVHVADPSNWPMLVTHISPAVLICCLGTTIRQAGSAPAFAGVDYQLVVDLARAACGAGARQMVVVSSVGAAPSSSNFYLRTKGQMERDVTALAFARLDIMRPGLLLGERCGPVRPGERIGMAIAPLTNLLTPRGFDQYRAISAATVAGAIAAVVGQTAGAPVDGPHIHHNREMIALAAAAN